MSDKSLVAPSPCVGRCSTTYGDWVCRGCKRYVHEVVNWNQLDDEVKAQVWQRLHDDIEQLMQPKFSITNSSQLLKASEALDALPKWPSGPFQQLYYLIIRKPSVLADPVRYGFKVLQPIEGARFPDQKEAIDEQLYELALAYYQRNFSI